MKSTTHTIRNLIQAWNRHRLDEITAFYAPDCTIVDVVHPTPLFGLEAIHKSFNTYLNTAPDLQVKCDDVLLDGDQLAAIWTAWGTHQGPFMRIPPTGRPFRISGVAVLRFRDDQITHARLVWDVAQLLRAFRLLPELPVASQEQKS